MHPGEADDLEFDEHNEAHLSIHNITATDVVQVWFSGPVYVPNRRGMTATWLMLGDTTGGRALTIAVVTDEIRLVLRPITGWDTTTAELTRWRPRRR